MHISSLCICCRLLCRFASERLKAPLGGLRGAPALLLFGSFGVHPGAGAGEATFWQLHRLHLFCSSFWTSIFVSASCYSIEQYNYSSISCSMKPEPAGAEPSQRGPNLSPCPCRWSHMFDSCVRQHWPINHAQICVQRRIKVTAHALTRW